MFNLSNNIIKGISKHKLIPSPSKTEIYINFVLFNPCKPLHIKHQLQQL